MICRWNSVQVRIFLAPSTELEVRHRVVYTTRVLYRMFGLRGEIFTLAMQQRYSILDQM